VRRAKYIKAWNDTLAQMSDKERKASAHPYDRDRGVEKNTQSIEDLQDLIGHVTQIVSRGRDAFLADTQDGWMARGAARNALHQYATIITEHLPRWWREANSVDVEGIRAIRNRMHNYPEIDDGEVFDELNRLPAEVSSFDLEVLTAQDTPPGELRTTFTSDHSETAD